jgi:GT2 family glycosyltransferase
MQNIDIIIPSYRADEKYLLPIFNMEVPCNCSIRFFLVIDNPHATLSQNIRALSQNPDIDIIINEKNLGASQTRNVGINAGNGEYILFLDDDITVKPDLLKIYHQAILDFPDETGFIGLVTFPPPNTAYTKAVLASGSGGIFNIALQKPSFAWGATANIMIKRSAMGAVRFSPLFPKAGGGEDVDFFLRIREINHFRDLKTLPQAQVWHPWWQHGKANLERPFRYGQGTALLKILHPQYTRYDFLSTPETLLVALIFYFFCLIFQSRLATPLGIFIVGIVVTEIITNLVNGLRSKNKISMPALFQVLLLKVSFDAGVLWVNISRKTFKGICKRFNDNGSFKKDHFIRFNRYKITKVILYVALIIWLMVVYK